MPSLILTDLNPELRQRVQAKAAAEGTTVKAVILRLLTQWLAAALLIGLASGCAYKLPVEPTRVVLPPSNTPAAIQLLAGSRSSSVLEVAAKVTTADGRFLTGVAVTFSAVPGRVAPEVTVTDDAGLARTVLTTTGTSIISATAGNLSASMALP